MPTLEEVVSAVKEKKMELPKGLALAHRGDDWKILLFPNRIQSEEDEKEYLAFCLSVADGIPAAVTEETGLKLGSYLAASEKMAGDEMYENAIMKVTAYYPLLNNVLAVGVLADHPSKGYEGGWFLMPPAREMSLVELIATGCWTVLTEDEAKKLAEERGLSFDSAYL